MESFVLILLFFDLKNNKITDNKSEYGALPIELMNKIHVGLEPTTPA